MTFRIAADIGGTFTDIALVTEAGRLVTRKVPSTPDDLARGVIDGIIATHRRRGAAAVGHQRSSARLHGGDQRDPGESRRADRAHHHRRVPRRSGDAAHPRAATLPAALREAARARAAPVAVRGYANAWDRAVRCLCRSTKHRVDRVIERLRREPVTAIAVCFLHSYANPDHERRVGERLRAAFPDHVHLALGRHPAGDPRIRAHQHDGDQLARRPADAGLSAARCSIGWRRRLRRSACG